MMPTNGSLIVIEFAGHVLALSESEFAQALERGHSVVPSLPAKRTEAVEPLLDAQRVAAVTGVPASWWSEQARRGVVPCRYFGKYPRFVLSEILECDRFKERCERP